MKALVIPGTLIGIHSNRATCLGMKNNFYFSQGPASSVEEHSLCNILLRQTFVQNSPYAGIFQAEKKFAIKFDVESLKHCQLELAKIQGIRKLLRLIQLSERDKYPE